MNPELLVKQGHVKPMISAQTIIEFHFRRVVRRLVLSLGRLRNQILRWEHFLDAGGPAGANPVLAFDIPEEAGIAADSVFHYLTLFADDLGRILPFVLLDRDVAEVTGFTEAKRLILKGTLAASSALRGLFETLEREGSWWHDGLKPRVGMRQRLTHYPDLLILQGTTKPGDTRMTTEAVLTTVGGPVRYLEFETALRELLADLCGWLDALHVELLDRLSEKLDHAGIAWRPLQDDCPGVTLPGEDAGCPRDPTDSYLPRCDVPAVGR